MSTPLSAMAGPSRDWLAGVRLLGALIASTLPLLACNVHNPGVTPPDRELNFPLVLTTSAPPAPGEPPGWLYLANTNYNFRFNRGSLMAVDLAQVDAALDRSCIDDVGPKDCDSVAGTYDDGRCCFSCRDIDDDVLCDGRDAPVLQACCYYSLKERGRTFVPDDGEVGIESFASDIALSSSGERLYLTVRSRNAVLSVDLDGGALECGQGTSGECPRSAYTGVQKPLAATDAQFGRLPLALAVGSAADFGVSGDAELLFTGHDDGSVSFLVDHGGGPELRANLGPLNGRINSMRFDPDSGFVHVAQETGTQVARIGATRVNGKLAPYSSSPLQLFGLVDNTYARDIAFAPLFPDRVNALVQGGSTAIVRSLYFLEIEPDLPTQAQTVEAERVGRGPARLEQAVVAGRSYLFASCYDDRSVFIFDTATRQLVAFIRGVLGPFGMAVDTERELAYIADFASSTVRVADLRWLGDPSLPTPRIVLALGQPEVEWSEF